MQMNANEVRDIIQDSTANDARNATWNNVEFYVWGDCHSHVDYIARNNVWDGVGASAWINLCVQICIHGDER